MGLRLGAPRAAFAAAAGAGERVEHRVRAGEERGAFGFTKRFKCCICSLLACFAGTGLDVLWKSFPEPTVLWLCERCRCALKNLRSVRSIVESFRLEKTAENI